MEKEEVEFREISFIREGKRTIFPFTFFFFFSPNNYIFKVCLNYVYRWKYIIARFPLQVSRSTGILSHFVNLNIVIPEAFILGSGEHHVDVGSIINLVCIIEKVRIGFFLFLIPFHSFRRNKNSILQRLGMINAVLFNFFSSYGRTRYHHSPLPFFFLFLFCRFFETGQPRPTGTYWKYQYRYFIVQNNKMYTVAKIFLSAALIPVQEK